MTNMLVPKKREGLCKLDWCLWVQWNWTICTNA